MLCCVGGFASRMGDVLAPPHFGGSDFASRMGDLLAPPQFRVPNGGFISPAPGLATGLVDIGFTRWMPPMQNWALFGSSGFWGGGLGGVRADGLVVVAVHGRRARGVR